MADNHWGWGCLRPCESSGSGESGSKAAQAAQLRPQKNIFLQMG
jgi:hypothetical protein